MTIRPGAEWGSTVPRPGDLRVCSTDADLVAALLDDDPRPLGVDGGDLHRSLGGPVGRDPVQELPIDLLRVDVDGRAFTAASHVVLRRSWWRGPVVAVMNTDHLGGWNVAPRAHPNDGRLDVVEVAASMPIRQRVMAARRLPQGTHLPHPSISNRRTTAAEWSFERPVQVWIDGVDVATARCICVRIDPDAAIVHA